MRKMSVNEMIEKGIGSYSRNGRVQAFNILPGAIAQLHMHPDSDSFHYIIEGEGKFLVESEDKGFPISQGDIVHVTQMTRYGIKNDSQKPLKLLCIHAPLPATFKEGDRFVCNKCGTEVEIMTARVGALMCCGTEMDLKRWQGEGAQMIVKQAILQTYSKYRLGDEFTCRSCGSKIKIVGVGGGGPISCCGFEL